MECIIYSAFFGLILSPVINTLIISKSMELINITDSVRDAIRIAKTLAQEYGNSHYSSAHLLKALMHKEVGLHEFLIAMGKDIGYLEEWAEIRIDEYPKVISESAISPDERLAFIFEEADYARISLGFFKIDSICVLLALVKPEVGFSTDQLRSFPVREKEIIEFCMLEKECRTSLFPDEEKDASQESSAVLSQYCIDRMKLPVGECPIVGREKEKRMMIEILGRRSRSNVVITGESGVGKTALVESLVNDIMKGMVPSYLKDTKIIELDNGALIAGATYKGEIEDRLKKIIKDLRRTDSIILFIDDIHILLDIKQGNNGAVNILKQELAKGGLTVIGTTTSDEYRKHIEPDSALCRCFEELHIVEPDIPSAILMVQSQLEGYVGFHRIDVSEDAVRECVYLSKRYIKERSLPDAAIDLLDRTLSSVKMNNELIVADTEEDKKTIIGIYEVAAVVADKTGIPVGKIQSGEKERLLNMEDNLRKRVVGQDPALKTLTDAILESRSGMNRVGQPIGSFFLLGPTGTGKTELAKALAETLFNDEKAMIRFDMSEFKEEHSAALLYGAPPGYVGYEEGGLLVNKIRQQPYAVVLFDEIEKAHPSVYDIFLQIMDEGKLHDRMGKEGDFSNSIILFTSNVGSDWLSRELAAGNRPATLQIMEMMSLHFRPEFLARLSEIVPFSPITDAILLKIFDIQFKSLLGILEDKGISIILNDEVKKKLAQKGFTARYGARQVSAVIRNYLRRPISRFIISGKLNKGDTLVAEMDADDSIVWDILSSGADNNKTDRL